MSDMNEIEELAQDYSNARATLAEHAQALREELDLVRSSHIVFIRAAVRDVTAAHARLYGAVEETPELFERPRTLVIAGVRVGYTKQRGKVVIEDEEAVIARIRKQLPEDQAELLIRTSERVHKQAVYDLTAGDLKRLGITITDDEDAVVIKPTDGDVDKLVNALLAEAERIEGEAA